MIKTVIFDIGNVLAGFGWEVFLQRNGYSKEIFSRIVKATVGSSAWPEYDRGRMTDEEVMEAFINNDPGIENEIRQCLDNLDGMMVRYEYAIPWIKELKQKGYQVLVLSNFARRAHKECKSALDFLEYVDGGILSYQEQTIKPEPEIYKRLIDRYGLTPEECVFLDDTEKNLTAAAEFGIQTIHFTDREKALEELRKLGVE